MPKRDFVKRNMTIEVISKNGQVPSADTTAHDYRRLLYMYGAATQIELNNFLEFNSIDEETRKDKIRLEWVKAAEAFQSVVQSEKGLPDTINCNVLNPEDEFIKKLVKIPAFKKTFSNHSISFEEVEIDKIIAGQRTVHLNYVETIKEKYLTTKPELQKFCLDIGENQAGPKASRTAQNAFTLSSENPGLRFLGAFESTKDNISEKYHPGGLPVSSVTLLFGYGLSTINVYRVNQRLILSNGFHRLYVLQSLGITRAPVVVQNIRHPKLELPETITQLPRDYLISDPRPGLMKDFFDERLNCEIKQGNFLKALQMVWGINESLVPN
jgi:hypothetical protein